MPVVTLALLATNAGVFLYELGAPTTGAPPTGTRFFADSGVAHFIFNAMFLWLFGDNVEDRLGRGTLLGCYIACGVTGGVAQSMLGGANSVPSVHVTAAIAGVVGAYFVLLPHSKILMLVPAPVALVEVPALFFLGMFWVLQFMNFVVTPAVRRLDTVPAAAMIALGVSFGLGAAVSGLLRKPVRW